MALTMAALALLEDIANGNIRREKVFREREDLLANHDNWLMSRFRLPRPVLLQLCAELQRALERNTARSPGLSSLILCPVLDFHSQIHSSSYSAT